MDYEKEYRHLHKNPKWFAGYTAIKYADTITEMVEKYGAATLLDYGSGKGYQYLKYRIHGPWGVLPVCYDIGVPQLSERPTGRFCGVICTDVMEHIEEKDVPGILKDIFGFVKPGGFVVLSISCRPSKRKKLSDGRNVHLTVKPPEWWDEAIKDIAGDVAFKVIYEEKRVDIER